MAGEGMIATWWGVLLIGLATALASGLGALPFLVTQRPSQAWLGRGNALAAGVMLGVSISLVIEGFERSIPSTTLGMLVGLGAILAAKAVLDRRGGDVSMDQLAGADAVKAILLVAVMTAHSFAEGVGVGVSFGGGERFGLAISLAIALHNIPQGLAVALVLIPQGVRIWKGAWWAVFTGLPQPIMAVPAFLFVLVFAPFLPFGFGFAAGAMTWMVFAELMPDANAELGEIKAGTLATLAVILTVGLQNGLMAL